MFKVHYLILIRDTISIIISKHFMFKVHENEIEINKLNVEFQNISCLRFINQNLRKTIDLFTFQNISCLRFIYYILFLLVYPLLFQNISCLRFIYKRCLRHLNNKSISKHFMFKVHLLLMTLWASASVISKHFMFKVHLTFYIFKLFTELFQNISCLRFINSNYLKNQVLYKFQNISCLRFIY